MMLPDRQLNYTSKLEINYGYVALHCKPVTDEIGYVALKRLPVIHATTLHTILPRQNIVIVVFHCN